MASPRRRLGPCPRGRSAVRDGKEKSTRKGHTAPGHQRGGEAPHSCSLLPTNPLSRGLRVGSAVPGAAAAHPKSRISNSPSLKLSPAFFLLLAAPITPRQLCLPEQSPRCSLPAASPLHRPAPVCARGRPGSAGHIGDTGAGCCLVISTKHPRAGAWAGVSAYGAGNS